MAETEVLEIAHQCEILAGEIAPVTTLKLNDLERLVLNDGGLFRIGPLTLIFIGSDTSGECIASATLNYTVDKNLSGSATCEVVRPPDPLISGESNDDSISVAEAICMIRDALQRLVSAIKNSGEVNKGNLSVIPIKDYRLKVSTGYKPANPQGQLKLFA